MKANKKLAVVALGCVASFAFGGAILTAKASAEEANANKFEMEYGVQVALKKDAMRWIVGMGQNVYDEIVTNDTENKVSLSFIVSSETQFKNVLDGKYMNIPDANKTTIAIPDEKIYKSGDFYYANAALEGLYATTQTKKDVVAVAVIATESEGAYTYEYANFNGGNINNNVRQQYDVLQQVVFDTEREEAKGWTEAILAETSPYKSWFGTENYPLVVNSADKYDSFITRINDNVNMNMNVELYTEYAMGSNVQLEPGKEIPATATKYHKVNFYNGDTLMDSVTVKDGETAVYGGEEIKSYATEAEYAESSNYMIGEKFDYWVTTRGGYTEADTTNVTSSMNVYTKFYRANVSPDLFKYARAEEPNTVLFADREFGFEAIKSTASKTALTAREYVTNRKLSGEQGSTKITYTYDGDDMYTNLYPSTDVTYGENDYVSFSVYLEAPANVNMVWFKLGSTPGVQVLNNSWGLVTFKASQWLASSTVTHVLDFRGAKTGDVMNLYFSKATVVPASEVKNLMTVSDTETYKVGDTTLVGKAVKSYWGEDLSTTGSGRPDIFNQDTEKDPHYINGQLMYYAQKVAYASRYFGFEFETAVTGKIYLTARGLSKNETDGHIMYCDAYPSRGAARINYFASKIVKEYDDGFVVYEFDFGANSVKYMEIISRTDFAYAQIVIKNISTKY